MTKINFVQNKSSLILVVLTLALSLGCGAKKTTFSSSRGSTSTPTTTHKLGECNRISFSTFNVMGQIGTYYEPGTGQYRADYLNVNLNTVPSEIFSFDKIQIQFFRWSEKSLGAKVENTIPVKMFFRDKLTGYTTAPTMVDKLSKSVIAQARQTLGSSWINVSSSQFFDRVMVILTGVDMTYEGLTIKYYDTSVGATPVAKGDILIPAFIADPNIYKQYNPFPDLYTLHPNYSLLNSGASEADYVAEINTICSELAGIGTRIPQSINDTKDSSGFFTQLWSSLKDFLNKISR